jgi:hypothetical protein
MRAKILTSLFIALSLLNIAAVNAREIRVPFTANHQSPSSFSTITNITCFIQQNRVSLNWTVSSNQLAEQFIVEKSADGKNFSTAALVFGTDKTDTDNYRFFEKAKSKKIFYRIKIVYKDQTVEYSSIIIAAEKN